jgi:pimeloyl-ACP methyl ester carboxylesterase
MLSPRVEHYVDNDSVAVHAIEIGMPSEDSVFVFVPGMINSADQGIEAVGDHINHRSIALSLRGRGRSSSPTAGYSFEDHVSDVNAVVTQLRLKRPIIVGHSVGAVIALRAASLLVEMQNLGGVVLIDFLPRYHAFGEKWVERVLSMNVNSMTEVAIREVANDSRAIDLSSELGALQAKAMLLTGEGPESLAPTNETAILSERFPELEVLVIRGAGHDLLSTHAGAVVDALKTFKSSKVDKPQLL